MTDTQHASPVTRYQAGDKIPSWLIDSEPAHPNAIRGEMVFATVCDVIDAQDYYAVIPLASGDFPYPLQFGGQGCRVFAASKVVKAAVGLTTFFTEGTSSWTPMTVAPKRLNFWQRLKNVFWL